MILIIIFLIEISIMNFLPEFFLFLCRSFSFKLSVPTAGSDEIMPFSSLIKNTEDMNCISSFINKKKCDIILNE